MADNYVLFSTFLPELTDQEIAWCEKYFRLCAKRAEIDEDFEFEDENILFDYNFESLGKPGTPIGLWMYSECGGSPHSVAVFVSSFLERWRPEGSFTFYWAYTCSKPRIDEFGGGTIHVTADEIKSCDGSCVVPKKEDNAS